MSDVAGAGLKSFEWFPGGPRKAAHGGIGSTLAKLGIGAFVGLLFFVAHHPGIAYVAWALAALVGGVSLASAAAREAIDRALDRFGQWIGRGVGAVLLGAIYLVVVTPVRFVRRLGGADDLHLRDGDRPSYWLVCDDDARKVRWASTMFATEARAKSGGNLKVALITLVLLVLLSEGVLRTQGFGHPVLYIADPDIGYYPQPNVTVDRYGGLVHTNQFGMRSPDVTAEKPPGVFRILMLGDSTLYGGSYIDQRDLFSSRILDKLNQRALPGKVEVLAMGVNGWGPFHERGYVEHFGTFGADLAIIQMPIDDVNRPLYGLMSVPFFSVNSPPRVALEEVANHLMWRYRDEHAGFDDAWEARQSQKGVAEYGRLVDDLRAHGAEVMLFVLPTRAPGLGRDEPANEAKWRTDLFTTVSGHGAKPFFPAGLFKDKGDPDVIYHDNVHLNPLGHSLYGDFILDHIVSDSARFQAWTAGAASPAGKAP